jgi:hypothetical protein
MWVRKLDSNSLTKTKNLSCRNEVTETSGRPHPLWPQNKWLHTPRTADYRHTGQDGWIQTELAFTLAKNATKPYPFEIIPLQTARKENNWKTKEALDRAAVTVETERIRGFDHWCLWWWLLYVTIQTERYTLLFKRNTIRYYWNWTLYVTIQTEHYKLLLKLNIIRYYSNGTLYVTIETEHYTLLFKRNNIRYYWNWTLYVTIQVKHYTLLFKRNIIRYYWNWTLYVTIQTEQYTLLLKLNIIRYYSNGTL